jgi:hypothetical protein
MSESIKIHELHALHSQWMSAIMLAKDELSSFSLRLKEIDAANTGQDIKAQVEHFQNQFIIQKEVIDVLEHDIKTDENRIAENAKENVTAVEHRRVVEDQNIRDRMEIFKKIFGELKMEYQGFLGKYL